MSIIPKYLLIKTRPKYLLIKIRPKYLLIKTRPKYLLIKTRPKLEGYNNNDNDNDNDLAFGAAEPLGKAISYPEHVYTHRDAEKKTHKNKCCGKNTDFQPIIIIFL